MQTHPVNKASRPPVRPVKKSRTERLIERAKAITPADCLHAVKKLLPHAAIVISLMLMTFFIIDRVNKPMGFMTNEFHKRLTFALALMAIYFAVQLIAIQRRQERAAHSRRVQAAQAARQTGTPSPRMPQTCSQSRPQNPADRYYYIRKE